MSEGLRSLRSTVKDVAKSIAYSAPARSFVRTSPRLGAAVMHVIHRADPDRENTGFTDEARYCYSAWLRHLSKAAENGMALPGALVEMGPGDSLGIGLSALLCGADHLYSVDAHRYASVERTLEVFDGLVELFRQRADIPTNDEYPDIKPHVSSYGFPHDVLPPEALDRSLDERRLQSIRAAIHAGMDGSDHGGISIKYAAPWNDASVVPAGSVDLVISQAVLEHVRDLDNAYAAMATWLRPGGSLSHQIDFRSHGTSLDWNGHWTYPAEIWKRLENDKTYRWINRQPLSSHAALMAKNGFQIVTTVRVSADNGVPRRRLAPEWRDLSPEDVACQAALVLARRH